MFQSHITLQMNDTVKALFSRRQTSNEYQTRAIMEMSVTKLKCVI